ncbi:S8 family serine peptidase [Bacillus sp. CH30_1T]|uniref:S8 family serine peptidase n=1 Tax=Bacillus sp. CH30_1T TaxID=2604836 RepID=UPI0021CD936A|nr:S8 family serine peptidase [Bacillus sp. CH30_1T]
MMKGSSITKKSAVIALSTGLLLSPVSNYSMPTATAEGWKAETVLSSLTEEQRQALHQLEVNNAEGLQGFQSSELASDEEISVIVQFKSKPGHVAVLEAEVQGKSIKKADAKAQVEKEHKIFKEDVVKHLSTSHLKGKKVAPKITQTYKEAYNGVAMTLPANQVEQLLKSEAVKAVFKNQAFTIDPVKQDLPNDVEREITTSVESIPYLNVDELHKEGITGDGIKVGVIDTGVDYNHPDLKDAYKGGYDFVDDDADPMEATYEDWKSTSEPEFSYTGSSYYTSHGTHVSGTIVGQNENDSEVSVEGVAPDADLYVYRVLGPYGSGYTEDVLAGIEKSVQDGMDVINLSLGASVNDPYYPTSTALNYAVLNGVTAVVSAGNAGPNDFTLGSPGTAALALTVGASDVPVSQTTFTGQTSDGWSAEIVSMARGFVHSFASLEDQSLELVDVGLGYEEDYENKNVEGKIAFVQRGNFALNDKVKFAKEHGAKAVIMYNNAEGHVGYNLGESTNYVPAFSMTLAAGEELKAAMTSGTSNFTFTNLEESMTEGDHLADFSSRGPVNKSYDTKPEVVAPGVSVLSTFPSYMIDPEKTDDYQYAYSRLSGTSMASPFTAGVAALLLGENPDLEPADIKTILMNSADPLNGDYSVFEVGAGRVDPYQALHSQTKIQIKDETLIPSGEELIPIDNPTGGLSFGNQVVAEGAHLRVQKSFEITNNSDEKKTFDIRVVENVQEGTLSLKENGVVVSADKSIKVNGGKKKTSNLFLTMPKTATKGIYEGYVIVTNKKDKTESYRVPFSVKRSEEGFNTLELLSSSFAPPHYTHGFEPYRYPWALVEFNLSSPMKSMDVILQDGETGEDLGLIGTLDLQDSLLDNNYLLRAFNGSYYAFTSDKKNPVSEEVSIAKPGHYKIKYAMTDPKGKVKTKTEHFYIDIEGPQFKSSLDGESPFLEYQPGQETYPFEIEITDPLIEDMQEAGMDADQSKNFMIYYWNSAFPSSPLYMDENGKFVEEIAMNENVKALNFRMKGYDMAGNNSAMKNYFFIKEGTPNAYLKTDAKTVTTGETVQATLALDNVQDAKEATWTFEDYYGFQPEVIDAKLSGEFSDKASLTLDGNQIKVTFNEPIQSFDHSAIVDVQVKVQDELFTKLDALDPTVTVTNSNNETMDLLHAGAEFTVNPDFNSIRGFVSPEGFDSGSGYNAKKDWTKVGATIEFKKSTGDVFTPSSITENGEYSIEKLPLSKDPYEVKVQVPGHFLTKNTERIGYEYNGELYGKYHRPTNLNPVGGDVNQDNVIDIYDAIAIQDAWNTDHRAADINFDGRVNANDIKFVQENYLLQNEQVEDAPSPVESADGKTLDSILEELGL